jgi:hypothetical protein
MEHASDMTDADPDRLRAHVMAAADQAVERMERDGEVLDPEEFATTVWAAAVPLYGDPDAAELNEKLESLDAPFSIATWH